MLILWACREFYKLNSTFEIALQFLTLIWDFIFILCGGGRPLMGADMLLSHDQLGHAIEQFFTLLLNFVYIILHF